MTATANFAALGLPEDLVKSIVAMGYTAPTSVQSEAIPKIQSGRDLIIQSRTGTGKTMAFGLPMLAKLDPTDLSTQLLVVCPTRELAMQVSEQISRAGAHRHLASTAVYGGAKIEPQIQALLYGSQVVVGTPGRLNDLIENKHLKLDKCRYAVLDEADEMLDMGFRLAIEYILGYLPNSRQTVLCSATMPPDVKAIAEVYMTNPDHLTVNMAQATPNKIRHVMLEAPSRQKQETVVELLRKEAPHIAIVFCRTKVETRELFSRVSRAGFRAGMLQGDMDQERRTETLERFKAGKFNVLVATDVAARGLDVDDISHVINYNVPGDPETYVHRSGRTGRIGKEGICITLVTPEDRYNFAQIEKKVSFEVYGQAPKARAVPAEVSAESRPEAPRPAAGRPDTRRSPEPRNGADIPREPRSAEAPRRAPATPSLSLNPADWAHLPDLVADLADDPLAARFRPLAESLLKGAPAEDLVRALLVQVLPKLKASPAGARPADGDDDSQRPRRRRRRRGSGDGARSGADA